MVRPRTALTRHQLPTTWEFDRDRGCPCPVHFHLFRLPLSDFFTDTLTRTRTWSSFGHARSGNVLGVPAPPVHDRRSIILSLNVPEWHLEIRHRLQNLGQEQNSIHTLLTTHRQNCRHPSFRAERAM